MSHAPIRLVAFDMEGCLTSDPTVWEIVHRRLGTWDSHGLPYWQSYRAGELEYDRFAQMDVAVWRGAVFSLLHQAAAAVPLTKGCEDLLRALSASGVTVAIITNGLACVAARFQHDFGVAHVRANRVIVSDDALTGEIDIRVPYAAKGEVLNSLAAELGVTCDQIAAVGDSTSDIAMFQCARLGIAFRPGHASVAEAATHVVRDGDLRPLISLLT